MAVPVSLIFPRGIWFQDCWKFKGDLNANQRLKTLLVDDDPPGQTWQDKVDDFVNYCIQAKIHTVSLGRLEDIIREDNTWGSSQAFDDYPTCNPIDGNVIRNRLKTLITQLHTSGVSMVLAHWRDKDPDTYNYDTNCNGAANYSPDEDACQCHNHNSEILDAFLTLNDPAGYDMGFDGIQMDYEYWSPLYGFDNSSPGNDFENAWDGYIAWTSWANELLAARGTNGINFIYAYVGKIMFTNPQAVAGNYFDLNNDLTTEREDTRQEIEDEIDQLGFDRIIMAFYVRDNMDIAPTDPNSDPGTFLNGAYNGSNETDEQRLRRRLQYFGNDPLNTQTNVIPIFFARNGDAANCTAADGYLGNALLGQCYWANHSWPELGGTSGENYLPEVEEEFIKQFFDYNIYTYLDCDQSFPDDEPYCSDPVYGNTNIYNGFFWHGYGLPADNDFQGMSYPPRNGDKRNARKYLTASRPMLALTEMQLGETK